MTWVVAIGNSEQFIQVSDRRLTDQSGEVIDDESNKAIIMLCENARLAIGFTGLARTGTFCTREWLLNTLNAAGPPEFAAKEIVERVGEMATREFSRNPLLSGLPKQAKRLTVMLAGYLYHHDPPLGALAIISNYFDVDSGELSPEAWDTFKVYLRQELRPSLSEPVLPFVIGAEPRVNKRLIAELVSLTERKKPAGAIVEKIVELFAAASSDPLLGDIIGDQLNIVVNPRDLKSPVITEYRSSVIRREAYLPDQAYVCKDRHLNISNIRIEPIDPSTPPMSGPKLHAKQPCWCHSGKKYKDCHGSKKKMGVCFIVSPTKKEVRNE
ncbi:MAG: SEC-C domain-containing protein [Acidobacteriota bacterium]